MAIGDTQTIKDITEMQLVQILSDPQLSNSYSYAANNPLTNKDPGGDFLQWTLATMARQTLGTAVRNVLAWTSNSLTLVDIYQGIGTRFDYESRKELTVDAASEYVEGHVTNRGKVVLDVLGITKEAIQDLPTFVKQANQTTVTYSRALTPIYNPNISHAISTPPTLTTPARGNGGGTIIVPGTSTPRSKEPIGSYQDKPVFCWGAC